ncbi:ABC transporter related protein [Allomeiothermus silvanus DSM 9946]|uniref:ABC transporter related protein n=1 Tax=Allomeiothermus silvanus (strain ATCC 700542 / DSM 9946 / NBRC 106475 / NCIMB 13440 / VI-R2) TaxID=526227 RepID=D7BBE4_ALLS1|nr:ABC transporter ATP-binding protein [Allomeiothermus silvanus]ADH62704.1 ABC transporter related protein [Allomeiothermus silvanus DSM 9946]MBI5812351.1 ABC transporter ATP-binding protein [Allomeiothermus silvanus]
MQVLEPKIQTSPAPPVLRVRSLSKRFGNVSAVERVDLEVHRGEIFGFLGPNGAGKTTTLGMILGLVRPTAGDIEVLGQRVGSGRTTVLRKVGALLGAPALYPHLSGRTHLELLARLQGGVSPGRIVEVLEWVGLSKAAHRLAGTYSTGMKQRLGIAMALLGEPELLILDEPTSGMDPAGMKETRELMKSLAASGITLIFSSHLLHEVEAVCDRIAVIHRGRLVAQGAVQELLSKGEGVRVKVDAPEEAALILSGLARRTEIVGDYLEVFGLDVKEIVRQLVAAGFVPSEVLPLRSDLEELFLELTREGEGR